MPRVCQSLAELQTSRLTATAFPKDIPVSLAQVSRRGSHCLRERAVEKINAGEGPSEKASYDVIMDMLLQVEKSSIGTEGQIHLEHTEVGICCCCVVAVAVALLDQY